MNEKKMGRKFKVGDKVIFTKEAIESRMFHKDIQVGDLAVVKSVESCVGGSFPTVVLPERDGLWLQCVDMDYEPEVYEWFEHADAKKEPKKKRKHFRMGDFVTLKDGVSVASVMSFSHFSSGMVGIIVGEEYSGAVTVRFVNNKKYDFETVSASALRLATKEERKTLRKHKVAKITYDNTSEIEEDAEVAEEKVKIPPEYDVKVGDIVEVTLDVNGHPVGTIGEVVLVREDSDDYYNSVKVRGNERILWNELDVKLVYRKPETESK